MSATLLRSWLALPRSLTPLPASGYCRQPPTTALRACGILLQPFPQNLLPFLQQCPLTSQHPTRQCQHSGGQRPPETGGSSPWLRGTRGVLDMSGQLARRCAHLGHSSIGTMVRVTFHGSEAPALGAGETPLLVQVCRCTGVWSVGCGGMHGPPLPTACVQRPDLRPPSPAEPLRLAGSP